MTPYDTCALRRLADALERSTVVSTIPQLPVHFYTEAPHSMHERIDALLQQAANLVFIVESMEGLHTADLVVTEGKTTTTMEQVDHTYPLNDDRRYRTTTRYSSH